MRGVVLADSGGRRRAELVSEKSAFLVDGCLRGVDYGDGVTDTHMQQRETSRCMFRVPVGVAAV